MATYPGLEPDTLDRVTRAFLDGMGETWRSGDNLAHAVASIEWLKGACAWPLFEAILGGMPPHEFGEVAARMRRGLVKDPPTEWWPALARALVANIGKLDM